MITFKKVNKWFGKLHVLKDIDLEITEGEVMVICGPSGSGKSTLIRCVNRLEPIQKGELFVAGTKVHDKSANMTQLRAETGFIFQSFNLYPHMTALGNTTIALTKVRKMKKEAAENLGRETLT
ncbi:MAG: ATP-binding cassette domain-containing protein, partial [Thermodesulfobacteriota bacterium]|nr:ATP-binding cassette domain-containing protein [Thermodesulfobacteriota bacterium]